MNLRRQGQSADYIVTGSWGKLAFKDASQLGKARLAATTETEGRFLRVPEASELDLDDTAAYVHVTSNETIAGTQIGEFPRTKAPLVADMSSDILSRPIDPSQFGLIYAGAQKNLGPSGLTLVIVRAELVEAANADIPRIFQYRTQAAANSMTNTPPTFGIYMLRNVLDWLKQQGGLEVIAERNREKAELLYGTLDERPDLYRVPVYGPSRSHMNVVFNLTTPELEKECIAEAQAKGMVGLKGHRSVGGLRASIYNACPIESVRALADFLRDFRQ
jgi:phosphoserine aminotransferase